MHILIAIIAFLTAYIWLPIVFASIGILFITCLNGVFWWKETLTNIYKDTERTLPEQAANKEENWNETYDKAEATLNNTSTFLAVSLGAGFIGLVFLAYM